MIRRILIIAKDKEIRFIKQADYKNLKVKKKKKKLETNLKSSMFNDIKGRI